MAHRVLIVDDEQRDINMLKMLLEYHYGEKFQVSTALNAFEALTEVEDFAPTLLFVDIKMPQMNGIDLIRLLKDSGKELYPVIVSAYDHFEYARCAISAGACDYILKPVQHLQLNEVIDKYFAWHHKKRILDNSDDKVLHLSSMVEKDIVSSVIFNVGDNEQIGDYLAFSGIDYSWGFALVFQFEQVQDSSLYSNIGVLKRTIRELINCEGVRFISSFIGNSIILFVFYDEINLKVCMGKITEMAHSIHSLIERTSTIKTNYSIGKEFSRIEDMNYSFRMCASLLSSKKEDISQPVDIQTPQNNTNHIVQKVRIGNFDDSTRQFCHELNMILPDTVAASHVEKLKLTEMIFAISGQLLGDDKEVYTLTSAIFEVDSPSLPKYCTKVFAFILKKYSDNKEKRQHQIINKICEYIEQRFDKQLTLTGLSQKFNINSFYLSRLFKEYTNENFVDYLTGLRIKKSMELIKSGEYSVKEISTMIGYNDQNYFSKVFKKTTGITPSEYRCTCSK